MIEVLIKVLIEVIIEVLIEVIPFIVFYLIDFNIIKKLEISLILCRQVNYHLNRNWVL